MIQGRKYNPGSEGNPSIIRQDNHVVVPEVQRAAYSVPLLAPTSRGGDYFDFFGKMPTFYIRPDGFECGLIYPTII